MSLFPKRVTLYAKVWLKITKIEPIFTTIDYHIKQSNSDKILSDRGNKLLDDGD